MYKIWINPKTFRFSPKLWKIISMDSSCKFSIMSKVMSVDNPTQRAFIWQQMATYLNVNSETLGQLSYLHFFKGHDSFNVHIWGLTVQQLVSSRNVYHRPHFTQMSHGNIFWSTRVCLQISRMLILVNLYKVSCWSGKMVLLVTFWPLFTIHKKSRN